MPRIVTRRQPADFRQIATLLICVSFCAARLPAQQPPAQAYALGFSQSQIATAPLAPTLNLSDPFTIEGWLFLEVATPGALVMGKYNSSSTTEPWLWALALDGTGRRISFAESTGQSGSTRSVQTTSDLPFFQWVHVAGVLSSGTLRLYLNGQLVGTQSGAGAPANGASPFALGSAAAQDGTPACCSIGGALSQVSLWNSALRHRTTGQPRQIPSSHPVNRVHQV